MGKTILILIKKAPLLTHSQLNRLASISTDIAQITLGSVVIPFLFDKQNPPMLGLGLVTSIIFWSLSLYFERKKDERR